MRVRTVLIVLGALILAVPIAGAVALLAVDRAYYARLAEDQVQAATGRELEIAGAIGIGLSLRPTLTVADVRFANAPWGSRPEMARIERLEVQLGLLSLLGGRPEIDRVVLVGADVVLETNQAGEGNWALRQAPAPTEAAPSEPRQDEPAASALPLVGEVSIERSRIAYRAAGGEAPTELVIDAARLSAADRGAPLRIALTGSLDTTPIRLDGSTGTLAALMSGEGPLSLDLSLAALGIEASVSGTVGDPVALAGLDLLVEAKGADLATLAAMVERFAPGAVPLVGVGPVALRGKVRGAADELSIEDLSATASLGSLGVTVDGTASGLPDAPRAELRIAAQGQDLAALGRLTGADLSASGPVRATAALTAEPARVALRDLELQVGPSDLRGQAGLTLAGPRPRVEAELSSDRLDLAALVGGGDDDDPAEQNAADGASDKLFSDEPLALDGLRAVDAAVTLTAGMLAAPRLELRDVRLEARLEDGVLRLEPVEAVLAGGATDARLSLDAAAGTPRLDLAVEAPQLGVGRLMAGLGYPDLVEGAADVRIELRGEGASSAALARSLDGQVRALMAGGRLRAELIDRLPDTARAVAGALLAKDARGWTDLRCMALLLPLRDGIGTLSLGLDSGVSTLGGDGTVDLGRERLDLLMTPRAKGLPLEVAVPIRIEGPLTDPGYRLDSAGAAQQLGSLLGGSLLPKDARDALQALSAEPASGPCIASASDTRPAETPATTGDRPPLEDLLRRGQENPEDLIRRGLEGLFGGDR